MSKVITRFPPSPTGFFHIGSARTALFNYLYAKKHGGKMIFRLEDTDSERNIETAVQSLVDGMQLLGLQHDNKTIFRQSERTENYVAALHKLIAAGHAYEAEESNDGSGKVVRFKNPNISLTFTDEIRGDVTFDTTELGDFVIARTINDPLYHLTVVVDDIDMGITHVIRGEDHISNTPRQILILEALGAERPVYAHLPMILNEDRSKMSKRKNPVDVAQYIADGFVPEAIVNFLALLGWSPGNDREFFTLEELIDAFDLSGVQKSGAVFNIDKLRSINQHYLKQMPLAEYITHLPEKFTSHPRSEIVAQILQERLHTFSDATKELTEGEWSFLFEDPVIDPDQLVWKKSDAVTTKQHLEHALATLSVIPESTFASVDQLRETLWAYAEEHGKGDVLWPIRFALSGKDRSPDPFTLMTILNKDTTIRRITNALVTLS